MLNYRRKSFIVIQANVPLTFSYSVQTVEEDKILPSKYLLSSDRWRSWLKNCAKIKSSLFLCFFYTDYFWQTVGISLKKEIISLSVLYSQTCYLEKRS